MNRRVLAVLSSICLLTAGATLATPKLLENIPLVWSPTSTLAGEGPLQKGGLTLTDGPVDVTLSGEIRDFFVTESPSYHGSISLVLHAKNAQGKEIWSGNVEGEADRFGRSYKAQNYYEVMSDMLIKASYRLLDNPEFQKAVAGS